MTNLCNLDGVILDAAEARISVLDRGFLFGDSIYEVLRTHGPVPFAWPEHLGRLRASATGLRLELDLDDAGLMRRVAATLAAAGDGDHYVRIVVTRGTGTAPNIDLGYAPGPPCWVILVRPLTAMSGMPSRLCVVDRLRVDRRALDPALKSGNYLNNVLGLAEAKQAGATDSVFLNAAGFVTEASTSNIFLVRGGRLSTPPLTAGILAGVTRALLIAFCRDRGIQVDEQDLTEADLRNADELFLTSTLRDIGPVTHLDGKALHGGGPGPFTRGLADEFRAHCDRLLRERYEPQLDALLKR